MIELSQIVRDFAAALKAADARAPQATNARTGLGFQPGIGPHSEARTVEIVAEQLARLWPDDYAERIRVGVPYPDNPRQKCDFGLDSDGVLEWAIEVKMLRILGDNGKVNDNILMHILSPYEAHRSALTDCLKLVRSSLGESKAILVYGYDASDWPLEPAIGAFEALASRWVQLGPQRTAGFDGLIHPVHRSGAVFAWQISDQGSV